MKVKQTTQIGTNEDGVTLQYMYRALCVDVRLSKEFFSSVTDDSGYCIDAPIQLMPSGSCVNDRNIAKIGCVFAAQV